MQALPQALARQFLEANSKYHDSAIAIAERNAAVIATLEAFREHDPNITVWDMLALFDKASSPELSKPPASYFVTVRRMRQERRR